MLQIKGRKVQLKVTYQKKTNRNHHKKWTSPKYKINTRKTEGNKTFTTQEFEWISACKDKLRKEDKAFLSFIDYYNLIKELGYKKEIE